MKLALLGPTYPFRGGIAHYTTLLCSQLQQEGHDTKFISFSRQYPKWLFPGKTDKDESEAPLTENGVEYLLDSMNPLSWLRTADAIIEQNPEILIIPWWHVFWAVPFRVIIDRVKRKSNARIIFICHNVVPHDAGAWQRWGRRWTLKRADGFVVHSIEEADQLSQLVRGAEIQRAFHPSYSAFDHTASEYRPPNEVGQILFFGFVRPYKGLECLLRAVAKLNKVQSIKLVVAGEFWSDKSDYEKLIVELGIEDIVTLEDKYIPNEELGELFCQSDVVALPYRSVTGSGALQMALGFGKPVVTSAIGSLREVVRDGFNGYAVEPDDVQALADALSKALEPAHHKELVDNIGSDTRFSWENIVQAIMAVSGKGETTT